MSLAGDLDLVVGDYDGMLTYFENTGTSTAPEFIFLDSPSESSPETSNANIQPYSYSYSYSYSYYFVFCPDLESAYLTCLETANQNGVDASAGNGWSCCNNPFPTTCAGMQTYSDFQDACGDPPAECAAEWHTYVECVYATALDAINDDLTGAAPLNCDLSCAATYSHSYLYSYDSYLYDDDDVATMPHSNQSSYSNLFNGFTVSGESNPAFADFDGDGTLRPRPSID